MGVNQSFSLTVLATAAEVAAGIVGAPISDMHDLQAKAELRDGWIRLNDWEALGDLDILQLLIEPSAQRGEAYVVTDLSYEPEQGAFHVRAGYLCAFARAYFESFGEALFNGDVIVLFPAQQAMFFFHHDGLTLHWG